MGNDTTITNKNITLASNSTTSNYVATMGWVNNPATSTNVVHRDGAETITGVKTFTGAVNMTTMPNGTDLTVKTQTQGDNSSKAASTAYVDTAITGAVGHPIPAISSSTDGQVLSNNGSAYYWKTVKDITTLAGLDDTTISTPTGGQSLVYDATTSKWINGAQTTATIRYW